MFLGFSLFRLGYPGLALLENWVLKMPNSLGFSCLGSFVFLSLFEGKSYGKDIYHDEKA